MTHKKLMGENLMRATGCDGCAWLKPEGHGVYECRSPNACVICNQWTPEGTLWIREEKAE